MKTNELMKRFDEMEEICRCFSTIFLFLHGEDPVLVEERTNQMLQIGRTVRDQSAIELDRRRKGRRSGDGRATAEQSVGEGKGNQRRVFGEQRQTIGMFRRKFVVGRRRTVEEQKIRLRFPLAKIRFLPLEEVFRLFELNSNVLDRTGQDGQTFRRQTIEVREENPRIRAEQTAMNVGDLLDTDRPVAEQFDQIDSTTLRRVTKVDRHRRRTGDGLPGRRTEGQTSDREESTDETNEAIRSAGRSSFPTAASERRSTNGDIRIGRECDCRTVEDEFSSRWTTSDRCDTSESTTIRNCSHSVHRHCRAVLNETKAKIRGFDERERARISLVKRSRKYNRWERKARSLLRCSSWMCWNCSSI